MAITIGSLAEFVGGHDISGKRITFILIYASTEVIVCEGLLILLPFIYVNP